MIIYNYYTKDTVQAPPEAPTPAEVEKLVGVEYKDDKFASVWVTDQAERHEPGYFDVNQDDHPNRIEIGKVVSDGEGRYTCKVTFLAQKFCDAYTKLKQNTPHTLVEDKKDDVVVKFVWDASANSGKGVWELAAGQTTPVTFQVECEQTYTLNYDANGGTGAPTAQTKKTTAKSVEFEVSGTKPTRDGYTFKGWSDDKDGTVAYNAGSKVTLNQAKPKLAVTKTIYAVWEKNASQLTIEKIASNSTPKAGEQFSYMIMVKNTGSTAVDNVTVTDVLDEHLEFVEATGNGTVKL